MVHSMSLSTQKSNKASANKLTTKEITIFAMLGALMFCSKIVMEILPNIHILGMLTMTYTIVYRKKALFPIYIYVLINGVFAGFATWWIPYLYVWTILWGVTMLLPKKMPMKVSAVVYPLVCCLHGLFFGVLYAPGQALLYGFNLEKTIAWIASGFTFDILHAMGDFAAGLLILPMVKLIRRMDCYIH